MNPYLSLALAIATELVGTTALKFVDGFTNVLAALVVFVGYGLSFYFLSRSLEELPIGLIYATWAGIGIVGIVTIGVVFFDEPTDAVGLLGIALILAGIYVLNVVSTMTVT